MVGFDASILILIALGFSIAIVTTMSGIGGGVFFVPIIMFIESVPITVAREISQMVILGTSLVGAITYLRQKRVNLKVGGVAAACSVAGVLVCKFYLMFLSNEIVTLIFAVFLIIISFYFVAPFLLQFWKKHTTRLATANISAEAPADVSPEALAGAPTGVPQDSCIMGEMPAYTGKKWVLKTAPLFFGAGILGALLGIGGGVIFVPVLNTVLDCPIHFCTATSSFVIVFNSTANVLVAGFRGQLDFLVGGSLILGALPGSYLGARYSQKVPKEVLKAILSAVLIMIGVIMLVQL
ncbi:MAG TPA: sulfite exporter TauE/SafE family protein [Candidatus Lokiarchaeia archaeon]|nr:sulfite exporter TauE/SafE family protein [Candidatus Lokiarchaeia archaeon]